MSRIYKSCGIQQAKTQLDQTVQQIMIPQHFEGNIVEISQGQWTEEASLQLRDITQWGVTALLLNVNYRATLVEEIAHIHFSDLTWLDLAGNNIESIEGLPRVYMAQMKEMFLRDNNITSVGVIRKATWPALKRLSIGNNYFGDGKRLTQGCFPQIHTLPLYYSWGEDKNKWTDKCFPGKMQATSLTDLYIQKRQFCFERSIKRVFQRKWPHVDIQ